MTSQLINNRYQIVAELGAGGIGTVTEAFDRLEQRTVAIKQVQMRPKQAADSLDESKAALVSIMVEFRTLASLRHPNIINVLDYGFDADQQPFFAMQYLHGASTIVEAAHGKSQERQIDYLIELLQALTYLHRREIMHRDLKPDNILVSANDQVKVLDFGLARGAFRDTGIELSEEAAGTMMYMAPEVISGEDTTIQADLYAVGLIAYEMLVGKFPYDSSNVMSILNDILNTQPDTSMLDVELAQAINWLLAKTPTDRPESAEIVIERLCQATNHTMPEESVLLRESFLQASRFVGRRKEFRRLRDALLETAGGGRSAWLIGGESGVGKSRLIDEIRSRALVSGVQVVRGQAVAEGGLPYQLWREPVRQLILASDLTDLEASILKPLVPDISNIMGREIGDAPELPGKPGQERLQLAIVSVFRRQTTPLLILLEDLHWITESLEVLKLLLGAKDQPGLMLIGTFRSDESPDLPDHLADMELLMLQRLEREAVADLSQSMLGEIGRQPELLDLLMQETEGNTFFMVEVVRALSEEAGSLSAIGTTGLPRSVMAGGVQQIIRRRLQRVPDWAQPTLQLAAVAGRGLDRAIIQTGATLSVEDYEDFLTVCANAAVFDLVDGGWRFSHDKLRESLLADMSQAEHQTLSRQVAEAIEHVYPESPAYVEVLYDHWNTADDADKILEYLVKVANRFIYDTSDYERTIAMLEPVVRDLATDNPHLSDLLIALSTAYTTIGDYENGRQYAERIIDLGLDTKNQAAACANLGIVTFRQGDYAASRDYHERSLELRQAIHDQHGIATSMNNVGVVNHVMGDAKTAQGYYEQSLAIRQEINDERGIGQSLDNLGLIYFSEGQLETALNYAQEALEIRETIGDKRTIGVSLNNMGIIYQTLDDLESAQICHERSLAIRQEIGDSYGEATSLCNLGSIYILRDQILEASQALYEGITLAYDIGFLAILMAGAIL